MDSAGALWDSIDALLDNFVMNVLVPWSLSEQVGSCHLDQVAQPFLGH